MAKFKYFIYDGNYFVDSFNSYKEAKEFLENLALRYPKYNCYIVKVRCY